MRRVTSHPSLGGVCHLHHLHSKKMSQVSSSGNPSHCYNSEAKGFGNRTFSSVLSPCYFSSVPRSFIQLVDGLYV
jgi:hypothetical protein